MQRSKDIDGKLITRMSDVFGAKSFQFFFTKEEIKDDDPEGTIIAAISSYGNVDKVGDIIVEGAFKEYVGKDDLRIPMYWQHSQMDIVGEWKSIWQEGKTIYAKGEIYQEMNKGQDVRALIKRGLVNSTSIGFIPKEYSIYEDDDLPFGYGFKFKEIELMETSIVLNPANPKAVISEVKNDNGQIVARELEKALRDVGLTQKESKILLAEGLTELIKRRDVLEDDGETSTKTLAEMLNDKLNK